MPPRALCVPRGAIEIVVAALSCRHHYSSEF